MASWTPERRRATWIKSGYSVYYAIFLVFIYGPMIAMFVLSFQGPRGGTSFPMRGFSLHWYNKLIEPSMVGDMQGALGRSLILAIIVMIITALFSTMLAMAFREPFPGSGVLFYTIMGGMISVIFTDFMQYIVISVGGGGQPAELVALALPQS